MWILIAAVGLLQAAAIAFFVFSKSKHLNDDAVKAFELLQDEVQQKRDLWSRVASFKEGLADQQDFAKAAQKFLQARDSLKAEQGRATISYAELEALEVRLRELEEIGRELEASSTETKEELKILQRKESELRSKNDALRGQIADSLSKMEALIAEIEMTAQMQEQVAVMRSELLRSEEKIQTMLNEIQTSNEQYFNLKRRYDALDVEYAQLYQQLTEQSQR
jgi:chromosome segregation ATPase